MINARTQRLQVIFVLAALPALSIPVLAQQSTDLTEIVVTAQRRLQSSQDVSISMQVVSGAELKERLIENAADLVKHAPNITFNSYYENGRPDIVIRGIGTGLTFGDASVAPVGYYFDEVFMGARYGQLSQVFDQERVEVLKGPQGTLFGRNTTAGAIDFVSKKPGKDFEANASVSYGRFNEVDTEAGVTMPVSSTLSIRIAGIYRHRDDYVTNLNPNCGQDVTFPTGPATPLSYREANCNLGGVDSYAARTLMKWDPTDNMDWLLNLHISGANDQTPVLYYNGSGIPNATFNNLVQVLPTGPNIYTGYQTPPLSWTQTDVDNPTFEHLKSYGAYLTGNMKFGALTFTSTSSYDRVTYREGQDDDGGSSVSQYLIEGSTTTSVSQEFRLASKSGPFDWVTGLYYYHDFLDSPYLPNFTLVDPSLAGTGLGRSGVGASTQTDVTDAIFGDLRYAVSDKFTLGIGGRYTYEKKYSNSAPSFNYYTDPPGPTFFGTVIPPDQIQSACPERRNEHSWSAPSGRFVVEYRPVEGILTYASVSHGFKSGGLTAVGVCGAVKTSYKPETVNAYELGVKTTLLERRLEVNGAAFYNDITDTQALVFAPNPADPKGQPVLQTTNAAKAHTYGAELELRAKPTEHLLASISYGYLEAIYDTFVFNPGPGPSTDILHHATIPYSPRSSVAATLEYDIPVGAVMIRPNLSASYRSEVIFEPHANPIIDTQGGYTLLDVAVPFEVDAGTSHYQVQLWAHNVTDKHYYTETLGLNGVLFYGAASTYRSLPRTYGISLSYSFK